MISPRGGGGGFHRGSCSTRPSRKEYEQCATGLRCCGGHRFWIQYHQLQLEVQGYMQDSCCHILLDKSAMSLLEGFSRLNVSVLGSALEGILDRADCDLVPEKYLNIIPNYFNCKKFEILTTRASWTVPCRWGRQWRPWQRSTMNQSSDLYNQRVKYIENASCSIFNRGGSHACLVLL